MTSLPLWNPNLKPGNLHTSLHIAGKASLASHLVKEGCSTTKQTKQGDTPLHRCVICLKSKNKRGHLLVPTLASNLHVCNAMGQTPLLLLAERLKHGQILCDQFSDWLMTILEATMKMPDGMCLLLCHSVTKFYLRYYCELWMYFFHCSLFWF